MLTPNKPLLQAAAALPATRHSRVPTTHGARAVERRALQGGMPRI
jgi:hypothetical protein